MKDWTEQFGQFINDLQSSSRKRVWELESQKGGVVQIYVAFDDEKEWTKDHLIEIPKIDICDFLGMDYYLDDSEYYIESFTPTFDPYNGYDEMRSDYPMDDHEFDFDEIQDFVISKGILDNGTY